VFIQLSLAPIKHGRRGEYPADTQFYVADEEIENTALLQEETSSSIEQSIKFDSMTPEKKRRWLFVRTCLELMIPKRNAVYNLVDNVLKQTEF
jgi:hypothetical protein